MININKEILEFNNFLNLSWPFVNCFYNKTDLINATLSDWFQMNWEILVECKVCHPGNFLQVYKEGAEANGEYSRITFMDKIATHYVKVVPQATTIHEYYTNSDMHFGNEDFMFSMFLQKVDGFFLLAPPFSLIEVYDEKGDTLYCFNKSEVSFYLVELNK
jgi:hypothetical protein